MSVQIGEYDPAVLYAAAANILVYSAPGTTTKEAMKCSGFKEVDMASDTYRKRIERLKKKIMTSYPSQITVINGSMSSPSILTIGSDVPQDSSNVVTTSGASSGTPSGESSNASSSASSGASIGE